MQRDQIGTGKKMRALIIEDNPVIALALEDELSDLGYVHIDVVESASQAIAAAEADCPDLIIADFRLANETSVAAVRHICRNKPIPSVYVAALVDEVLSEEPDATVLEKPVAPRVLRETIARITKQSVAHFS
jgi:CheY-like chemotaxis protein